MRNVGKISETVLKRSVIKPIEQNKVGITGASSSLDCAFLDNISAGDGIGLAIGYVAYKDQRACSHAISQACNNLWAQGVQPGSIMLSISMPDSYREIKLKEIMKQACEAAEKNAVPIAGGHTEYVQGLLNPVISVTALGSKTEVVADNDQKAEDSTQKAGLGIVMTKWMALEGTSVIAREMREELISRLPAYYVDEAIGLDQFIDISPEARIAQICPGTVMMHDVAGGGVFTALWEICGALGCGCNVELNDIPVLQESIEVCEFFDINPYRLRGDGSMLIVSSQAEELVRRIRAQEINATIIGRTTDNIDKCVIRDDESRFLEPANGDEILKVITA